MPRFHLRQFAVDDRITVHLVDENRAVTASTRDVAIRNQFYRRKRPDGTTIDDVEWSLAQLEDAVAPVLKSVRMLWPLELETKARLAELIAFQAVRGPRWLQWHHDFTKKAMEEQRQEAVLELESGLFVPVSRTQVDEMEERLLSDTERLLRMMGVANKLITIFGSMRWDLLVFDDDLLVLSDHPVVEWPLNLAARRAGHIPTGHGMLNVLEVRVPLSANSALLMTWFDSSVDPDPITGTRAHAANLNALSIEQAEKQWLHAPGISPPVADGVIRPLAPELLPGYVPLVAESSTVRTEVSKRVNSRLGEETTGSAEIVSLRKR